MNYEKMTKAQLIEALKAEQQKNLKTFRVMLTCDEYEGLTEEVVLEELDKLINKTPFLRDNCFYIDDVAENEDW